MALGSARCRRARRVISVLVSLDAAFLLFVVGSVWLHAMERNDALLLIAHTIHVFTILNGLVVIYNTAYSYDILRRLIATAMVALICDTGVLLIRVVRAWQTPDDAMLRIALAKSLNVDPIQLINNTALAHVLRPEVRYHAQLAYIVMAALLLLLDLAIAFFADDMRESVLALQARK